MILRANFIVLSVALLGAKSASAAVIADYQADFAAGMSSATPQVPTAGWTYERNPINVDLTTPSGWVPLQYDTGNFPHFDSDGSNPGWPDAAPGAYTIVGGASLTHPGQGSAQAGDGKEHYTILSYTLPSAGTISVINLTSSVGGSQNGTHIVVGTVAGGLFSQANDFQVAPNGNIAPSATNFGVLAAGTQVIVALGPKATDGSDSSSLSYQINSEAVPEPTGALLGMGLAGLAAIRRRRPV